MRRCQYDGCGERGGLFSDRVAACSHCGCALSPVTAAELELAVEEEHSRSQEEEARRAAPADAFSAFVPAVVLAP